MSEIPEYASIVENNGPAYDEVDAARLQDFNTYNDDGTTALIPITIEELEPQIQLSESYIQATTKSKSIKTVAIQSALAGVGAAILIIAIICFAEAKDSDSAVDIIWNAAGYIGMVFFLGVAALTVGLVMGGLRNTKLADAFKNDYVTNTISQYMTILKKDDKNVFFSTQVTNAAKDCLKQQVNDNNVVRDLTQTEKDTKITQTQKTDPPLCFESFKQPELISSGNLYEKLFQILRLGKDGSVANEYPFKFVNCPEYILAEINNKTFFACNVHTSTDHAPSDFKGQIIILPLKDNIQKPIILHYNASSQQFVSDTYHKNFYNAFTESTHFDELMRAIPDYDQDNFRTYLNLLKTLTPSSWTVYLINDLLIFAFCTDRYHFDFENELMTKSEHNGLARQLASDIVSFVQITNCLSHINFIKTTY